MYKEQPDATAREVGGDFYDFFMVDEEHLAVVIGDVSGKGVPASMFMAITKILIKNYTKTGFAPGRVLTSVNQLLCEGNDSSSFITVFMGMLDLTTGKLTYANAGHNRPLIKLRDRGLCRRAGAGGRYHHADA